MNNYYSRGKQNKPQIQLDPRDQLNSGFDDFGDFDDDFSQPAAASPVQRRPAPPVQEDRYEYYDRISSDRNYSDTVRGYDDLESEDKQKKSPTKDSSKILSVILALMCLLTACFVGSGDVIFSNTDVNDQLSARLDLQIGFDVLTENVFNVAHGMPKVYTLPMNESPASPPLEENYSSYIDEEGIEHQTYIDDTISVDCWRKRYYVNDVSCMVAVSKIKIAHPTQLRSAFAGGQYGTARLVPSQISKQVNAIVSINGELYNYASRKTLLIRQGTMYRDGNFNGIDTLFIDSNGDFTIMRDNEASAAGFYNSGERTIYQTVNFGPALVMDGEVIDYQSYCQENCYYRNPRSGIGQIGHLEYLLVAAEGRADDSKGLTTYDFGVLMQSLGCTQAYNVDGGQSSMLIFHNKPFNHISNGGERTFSDIIYFGSALPQQ